MGCPTEFLHLCNYIGANGWRRFYLAILFGLIRMAGRFLPSPLRLTDPERFSRQKAETLLDQSSPPHVIKDIII